MPVYEDRFWPQFLWMFAVMAIVIVGGAAILNAVWA